MHECINVTFAGEPPWKEKNLHGLVQLHMLLASWVGPPDYDRKVPVELKECLEICFAKEPEKRPTASSLLQCSFLIGSLFTYKCAYVSI
jgi:hypothetical protein